MKQPYSIHLDQHILDDLKDRLARTRWTQEIDNSNWKHGTDQKYLHELCSYWQNQFDWRKQEAELNSFDQYLTTINGHQIHFIHQKGEGNRRVPLLISHGWPDGIARFTKLIPLLTKADEIGVSFDVIAPSIPGYGFSDPMKSPLSIKDIAGLFHELMIGELGYENFVAHGGDWGSGITEALAQYHKESVSAIHLTDVPSIHAMIGIDDCSAAEKKYLEEMKQWQQAEGAYAMIQGTKPQTLAYALNDSPAGLAGWIIEKYYAWSDNDGNIENAFSKDELLTNLTIYWATQTINSSFRTYQTAMELVMKEKMNPLAKLNPFDKTSSKSTVPAAFALFPKDISSPPREFAERFFTVSRWTKMKAGGHFAALEQPEALAEDIREFVMDLDSVKA